MSTTLNPYLSFRDHAREAMEFYQTVFGGKLDVHPFSEYEATPSEGDDNSVMHASLEAENGITIMGADTPPGMEYKPGASISMSLNGDDEAELTAYFEKLSDGATIEQPLKKAPWGDTFGMLTDKFGTHWMINIAGQKA
jgi:PhnB protein